MKNLLTTIITLLSVAQLLAQPSQQGPKETVIRGQVVDQANQKPLSYSTVSLYTADEESLLKGTITDEKGKFVLNIAPGQYTLKFQYLSYQTSVIELDISPGEEEKNLKIVALKTDNTQLEEVVVTSEKEQLEFSLDKRSFNVSDNISNHGKSAAAILDNLPSVQVDIEGNVSLRGNENVNILVDGKPSGLVGISSQDALRQMQGSMIERIEVITNPSARYDAEGTAGIINIVLKKEAKKGINGSLGADIGYPTRLNGNLNMNYRSGKLNFFVSGGGQLRRNDGSGYSKQIFYNAETPFQTLRDRTHSRDGFSQNFRFGSDYYFTEKSVLTAAVLIKNSDEENRARIRYEDSDLEDEIYNSEIRRDVEIENEEYQEFSLNYKRDFDAKDHSLTLFAQFRNSAEIEDSDIEHQYLTDETDTLQAVLNDEGEKTALFQIDYVHPFGQNQKMEFGARSNIRRIKNDYLVEQLNPSSNIYERVDQFSSDFEYDENIHAIYGIYGNDLGKFSFQVGMRVEITDITTRLIDSDSTNHKQYGNYFPSAHVTYSLSKNEDIQASYSRRMRRPRFRSLNPFSSFSDVRNLRTGNPDLDPELTDAYEIGYLINWDDASVYGGVYYNYSTDVIQRISQYVPIEEDTIIISQPYNLAERSSYGLELTLSKEFGQWLKMNGSFNFFRSVTTGAVTLEQQETVLDADARSWSARLNSIVSLPMEIDFQANVNYRGPQNTTQGKRLAFYTVDLGATKDIFNKKATITASVQDLLNSRKWRGERSTDSFTESSEFQWRARQFLISFIYRINQQPRGKGKGGRKNTQNRAPGVDSGDSSF